MICRHSERRWIFACLTPVRIALASIFTDVPSLHSLICCQSELCWIFACLLPVCIALTYVFAYLLSLRTAFADLLLLRTVLDVCLSTASRHRNDIYLRLFASLLTVRYFAYIPPIGITLKFSLICCPPPPEPPLLMRCHSELCSIFCYLPPVCITVT